MADNCIGGFFVGFFAVKRISNAFCTAIGTNPKRIWDGYTPTLFGAARLRQRYGSYGEA